jgi:hypothetical protein
MRCLEIFGAIEVPSSYFTSVSWFDNWIILGIIGKGLTGRPPEQYGPLPQYRAEPIGQSPLHPCVRQALLRPRAVARLKTAARRRFPDTAPGFRPQVHSRLGLIPAPLNR